jgi:Cupin
MLQQLLSSLPELLALEQLDTRAELYQYLQLYATYTYYSILISHTVFITCFTMPTAGRTVVNTLKSGDVTFFPQGLVRTEYNMGCSKAVLLLANSSEDYGVSLITTRFGVLASLPREPLAGAL